MMHQKILIFLQLLIWSSIAMAHGDVHQRIYQLSKQIAQYPGKIDLLISRGEMFLLEGHAKEAYEDLATVRRLAPHRHDVLYPFAKSQLLMNQPELALVSIKELIAQADNDAIRMRACLLLGDILSATAKHLDAANAYHQAIVLSDPLEPDTVLFAANAFRLAGYADRALEELDFGMTRLGPLQTLNEMALELEMEKSKYAAALRRIEQMLGNKRSQAFLLYQKGCALQALSRKSEARQAFTETLQAIAELPVSRQNLEPLVKLKSATQVSLQNLALSTVQLSD